MMDSDKIREFERGRLAKEWSTYQRRRSREAVGDVLSEISHLCETDPMEMLEVVLEISRREPGEEMLGVLAAGPLEDLIQESGSVIVDRIEREAGSNEVFRHLLGRLWLSVDDALFARIHRAAGSPDDMKNWKDDVVT